MYFLKFLARSFTKPTYAFHNSVRLKFVILPSFTRHFSTKAKYSRSKLWKHLDVLCGTATGISLSLVFYRSPVVVNESDANSRLNAISSRNDYTCVISKSRELLWRLKDEVGAPGLVVGVSIDGETIWEEGFGYADVENRVLCTPNTVMRIASISKSITMAAVAKLWESGKLDLDKPVQQYVPEFPQKYFSGNPVEITSRHLVSHLGGIRHYDKSLPANSKSDAKTTDEDKLHPTASSGKKKEPENGKVVKEFEHKEYYIKEKYPDIRSALDLFKDDPLVSKPGTKFHYSTHGWTLISAAVENASGEPFTTHIAKLFKTLGMKHTHLDVNESLVYHRSRYYSKDKHGHLINSPYVDNSYKWAGGGFLSTVGDLLKFANSMLYSLQYKPSLQCETSNEMVKNKMEDTTTSMKSDDSQKQLSGIIKNQAGYLSSETVKALWTPVTAIKDKEIMYAMGWAVLPEKKECGFCDVQRFFASHSGGAIGASSILLILPKQCGTQSCLECQWSSPPKGVIVTIMTNLQEIALSKVALEIAIMFDCFSSVACS